MKINKENKRELKRFKTNTKPIIAIITIIGIFAVLALNFLTLKNKTISKDLKTINNNEKALEQEGQNYRLIISSDNVQVPVPKGYVASNVTGENYVSPEYTYDNETKTKIHDGGFVIYQLTDEELETDPNGTNVVINNANKDEAQESRNQYVWVPVPNVGDLVRTKTINDGIMQFGQLYVFSETQIYRNTGSNTNNLTEPRLVEQYDKTKHYLQRYSNLNKRENYLNDQQEEFKNMISSVEKYGGYYIGRYETGDDYTHSTTKNYFTKPRVVRYNNNIGYVTWYDGYKALKRLSGKNEKYIQTGMIYNTMWDYTLKWLNITGTRSFKDLIVDSGTWGNYYNNSKTVISGRTDPARTGAIDTITYKGVTYNDSPTSSNNIFDLAGNIMEYTEGRYINIARELRGGYHESSSNNKNNLAAGHNYNYPYSTDKSIGVRSYLCIK